MPVPQIVNTVIATAQQNQAWVLFSTLGVTLYELGHSYGETGDAHGYTANLAQTVIDTLATGNQTLIDLLVKDLGETYTHCVNKEAEYGDTSSGTYWGSGLMFTISAALVGKSLYDYCTGNQTLAQHCKGQRENEYQSINNNSL